MRRASRPAKDLPSIVEKLVAAYGAPAAPHPLDPFQMVLWENVAYLLDDDRRRAAFEALRTRIGLTPERILAAPRRQLREVAALGGMHPERRAENLKRIAEITVSQLGGDLRQVLKLPAARAKAALRKYPGIGEPGAEKILLFNRALAVLALESNGLRVLLRLGFGDQKKSYAATYRGVQEAAGARMGEDFDRLIRAHQILKVHGRELCRNSAPSCEACPVSPECAYFQKQG